MKINISNTNKKIKELNESQKNILFSYNLKVSSVLPSELVEVLQLDQEKKYTISGASDIGGSPLRRYIKAYNPLMEKIKKRRKLLRVLGNGINNKVSVIDLIEHG